jgi:hypothetical protein
MKLLQALLLSLMVTTAACSSDDSNSTTSGGSCAEAKKVADECNAKPKDGGTTITINFDQAKCESGGAQGETAAKCIVTNRTNCDCFIACGLKGTCP